MLGWLRSLFRVRAENPAVVVRSKATVPPLAREPRTCGTLSAAEFATFKKLLACPDCGSDEIHEASSGCGGQITGNIYCKNCGAMFDVSPFEMSRIREGRSQ